MKSKVFAVMGLFLLFVCSAYAGSLTIPNTFVSDTPALAQEVNENFTEIATQVNDNDVRVSTVTGTLFYSVSSLAFFPGQNIAVSKFPPTGYVFPANGTSTAYAPVTLPDGATVNELHMYYVKNDGFEFGPVFDLKFVINELGTNSISNAFRVTATGASPNIKLASDTTDSFIVDNSRYSYYLHASGGYTTLGDHILQGVVIGYSL